LQAPPPFTLETRQESPVEQVAERHRLAAFAALVERRVRVGRRVDLAPLPT
jgi:hypothetical protein